MQLVKDIRAVPAFSADYKDFNVLADFLNRFPTCLIVSEANPVRARLSATAAQWLWSSHAARNVATDGMRPDTLHISLPDDWAAYVDMPLTDTEIEKVRNSVNRQTPFGREEWRNELCARMGLESTLRSLGWPKGQKRGSNKQPVPLAFLYYKRLQKQKMEF